MDGFGSICDNNTVIQLNTWYHVAFCRSGTVTKVYLNGNLDGTGSIANVNGDINYGGIVNLNSLFVGESPDAYSSCFDGYIDELRITNRIARYMSNFSVPVSAFPDI